LSRVRPCDPPLLRGNGERSLTVSLVPRREGGLLEGWTVTGPDATGYWDISSNQVLEFGIFGLLLRLSVENITEEDLKLPVTFDNYVYPAPKKLVHPPAIPLGPPQRPTAVSTPTPTPTSTAKTTSATIQNSTFIPAQLTVERGTRVTWTNQDALAHTVAGFRYPGRL
jgi:hypothetical protein